MTKMNELIGDLPTHCLIMHEGRLAVSKDRAVIILAHIYPSFFASDKSLGERRRGEQKLARRMIDASNKIRTLDSEGVQKNAVTGPSDNLGT